VSGEPSEADKLAAEGRLDEALSLAWRALDRSGGLAEKRLVCSLLSGAPHLASRDRQKELLRLLQDPDVDPNALSQAAWTLVLEEGVLAGGPGAVEEDEFTLRLLQETFVSSLEAELALTAMRRELLLTGEHRHYPRLTEALVRQAQHNGGAWWFDEEERAHLQRHDSFAPAFLPTRPVPQGESPYQDEVTAAVAHQYRSWPYPVWTRITAPIPSNLPELSRALDPDRPPLPLRSDILIAGCGTGREAAQLARWFPDAHITAIDLSEASIAYAAERCAGLGVEFKVADLHRIGELGRSFDLISTSGVLHHLPDAEAGWAALTSVLKPAGMMKVMLYSKLGRLRVRAARACLGEITQQPVTDDLLRLARRTVIEKGPALLARSLDFYTLGGAHDLLLHAQEDAFDIPRIESAMEKLRLDLVAFNLPTDAHRTRYRKERPDDPFFRSFEGWHELEKKEPFLFAGMYEFWCRPKADRTG
jgi:SAM-dependent methyltransferase